VRGFFRGDDGFVAPLADRLLGSPQIYAHKQREAEASVNFVTCHDGFTLNDLVSYQQKHNEANGESNRDGSDDNRSNNFGVEGPSDDPSVEVLRNREVKNFFAVTMLSLGLPMILMGDEVRRTQNGNNNAYCLDDETNWLDWTLIARHADVHRFVALINAHRLTPRFWPELRDVSLNELLRAGDRTWHGVKFGQPDWSVNSHSVALLVALRDRSLVLYLILNAYWEPLEFELPSGDGCQWHRWIDTSLDSPHDIAEWSEAPPVSSGSYRAAAHSVVGLYSQF
jgi:glycogen operon protein